MMPGRGDGKQRLAKNRFVCQAIELPRAVAGANTLRKPLLSQVAPSLVDHDLDPRVPARRQDVGIEIVLDEGWSKLPEQSLAQDRHAI